MLGTPGNDVLTGTAGRDCILGFGGDDVLRGLGGNDFIAGGAGNDTIDGGAGDDQLFGETGNDVLAGDNGADDLQGGQGDDRLYGGNGADTVDGGAGDDALDGGAGADTLRGAGGNDTIVSEPRDSVHGGPGTDACRGIACELAPCTAPGAVLRTFSRDADGDGIGTNAIVVVACSAPAGYVLASGDCNDSDPSISPAATEICNSIDDNCDGIVDSTACACLNVVCTALDQCHAAGVCNPATGLCSNVTKASGSACDDANACTQTDTCQVGACTGTNPVLCGATGVCHDAGACDPATGACSNPITPDGVSCDDGSGCTQADRCQAGVCTGTACPAGQTCTAGACVSNSACPAGQALCGGVCIDIVSNASNCGACGVSCGESQACTAGVCGPDCRGKTLCGGTTCRDTSRDTLNCGACGNVCPPVVDGVVACQASACVTSCNAGYALAGSACTFAAPAIPRQLAPLSVATVTTYLPRLRWQLAAGTDGARVEVCADRACASLTQTFDSIGVSGSPASPLAPGVYFWRIRGMNAGTVTTAASSVWQFIVPKHSTAVDSAWGTTPDFNGDGFADVIASTASTQRVFVYNGSPSGIAAVPSLTISAPVGENLFGIALGSAGDVNGDGFADAVVMGYAQPQRMYVYHGGPAGLGATPAAILSGLDQASTAIEPAALGDVNGDGFADVMLAFSGTAKLCYGGPSGLSDARALVLFGPAPLDPNAFGWPPDRSFGDASAAGDVNGDGFSDALVLTRNDAVLNGYPLQRAVEVHFGTPAGLDRAASLRLDVTVGLAAGANDVNADGFADLALVQLNSTTAVVFVHHGDPLGTQAMPGSSVTVPVSSGLLFVYAKGVRDTNGDGYDDLMLALGGSAGNRVVIHQGGPGGIAPTAARSIPGPVGVSNYGRPSAVAGDLDRDGFDDVLIGASGTRLFVHRGAAGGLVIAPAITLTSPAGSSGFPSAVE